MDKGTCLHLGTFIKVHGFQGHMQLKTYQDIPGQPETLESVFIEMDGILVPFFIESFSPHSDGLYLLRLEGITDREEAIQYIGSDVYIATGDRQLPSDPSHPFRFTQFTVLNGKDEETGIVVGFRDIPENPILIVERAGNEWMIPFHPDLIISIDRAARTLKMDIPDGLMEGE
jgi:16S rRNA processing protein RimM